MSQLGTSGSDFWLAVQEWESGLSVGNFGVNYQLGSGDWVVSFDNGFVGTGVWGETDWGGKTIRINPETLSWSGFFFKVALHEVGHASGFGDVTNANCGATSSVMKTGLAGGQGPGALTSADQCGVNERYYIRDESPIIVNLDRNALRLTGPEVLFDVANDGHPEYMGWTRTGSMDAFLAWDRNGDSRITNGSELFGNATPMSFTELGPLAQQGFEALAWLDEPAQGGNGDWRLTSADEAFGLLRLWIDANHDGVSQANEIFTLAAKGVVEIEVDAKSSRRVDQFGNEFRYRARVKQLNDRGNVVSKFAYDVFLATF